MAHAREYAHKAAAVAPQSPAVRDLLAALAEPAPRRRSSTAAIASLRADCTHASRLGKGPRRSRAIRLRGDLLRLSRSRGTSRSSGCCLRFYAAPRRIRIR
jgi:hypothetical protein